MSDIYDDEGYNSWPAWESGNDDARIESIMTDFKNELAVEIHQIERDAKAECYYKFLSSYHKVFLPEEDYDVDAEWWYE